MAKSKSGNILIVDDDRDILKAANLYLKQHFNFIKCIDAPSQIPPRLDEVHYDLILLDMNFTESVSSGKEGFAWLKKIHEIDPSIAVVLITAYGNVEKAVKALKMGAADFVMKPWNNEKLLATVHAALNLVDSKREATKLRSRQKQLNEQIDRHYQDMIGRSEAMQKVFETIEKVAHTPANVLITGENGTGKQLAARALHRRSKRSDNVFIDVDIGALSESLFESELFGHSKGAFTDAKEDRAGRFEIADEGTLFLDEIGNIPLSLQPKLLSVIENRKVTRIGSNNPVDIDIRLICATNESIEILSDEERFRQDLLFRINTIHINIPPLRERKEDIPLLVQHFIEKYRQKYDKNTQSVVDAAMQQLKTYQWPGNVRELEHAVERAIIMSDSTVLKSADLLNQPAASEGDVGEETLNLEKIEQKAIQKVLDKCNNNISKSAVKLGISRAALYRRIKKYDL